MDALLELLVLLSSPRRVVEVSLCRRCRDSDSATRVLSLRPREIATAAVPSWMPDIEMYGAPCHFADFARKSTSIGPHFMLVIPRKK
jgi:hypothetical protein